MEVEVVLLPWTVAVCIYVYHVLLICAIVLVVLNILRYYSVFVYLEFYVPINISVPGYYNQFFVSN